MRFYCFDQKEIVASRPDGMLDLTIDPKLAWALDNRARFPLDVNRADRESLLRVPGLGVKVVNRILQVRRYRTLRLADLARLCHSLEKIRPYVTALAWQPGGLTDRADRRGRLAPQPPPLARF